jgi:hypothetical protein
MTFVTASDTASRIASICSPVVPTAWANRVTAARARGTLPETAG